MMDIPEKQELQAYLTWYRNFPDKEIDLEVIPYLSRDLKAHKSGWVRRTRIASLISTGEVARKLGMNRTSYSRLERRDQEGHLSISQISRIAEALDCDLICALRPKTHERFSVRIWKRLREASIGHSWVRTRPAARKGAALAAIVLRKSADSGFRKSQGWTVRKHSPNIQN